jgi:hypothetical protein
LNLRSNSRRGTYMEHLQFGLSFATLLRPRQNLVQRVSLGVGSHLHYFPAPSEHFLPKGLSESFAPIPGGGHATYRAELFMPVVPMWRSTTANSRATLPLM